MKKLISIFVIIAIFLSLSTLVRASDSCEVSNVIDPSVEVLSFSGDDTFQVEEVEYTYSLTRQKDNSQNANVVLPFTLRVGEKEYTCTASGVVNAYHLSTGDLLWEGPLDGCIFIDDIEYSVIAGFAKLDSSSSIQITVTIQSLTESNLITPTIICFGENVITQEIHQDISEHSENITLDNSSISNFAGTMSNDEAFQFIGALPKNFTLIDQTMLGQSARVYFSDQTNRLIVGIRTFCCNIEEYWDEKSITDVETVVDSFEIGITRNDYTTSSYSWIDGIESFDFNASNFGAGAVFLIDLFYDALSILGVPTTTLSSVLDSLKGSVEKDVTTTEASVSVSFGLFESANFDSLDVGIPIVFQLDRNHNGYLGWSSYTFLTSIRYRSYVWLSNWNWPRYVYTDTTDASREFKINLG